MKQAFTTTLIFLFWTTGLLAQSWYPVGATWYFERSPAGLPDQKSYFKMEITGDTVLGGKTARIMDKYNRELVDGHVIETHVPEARTYLREVNDTVWFYQDSAYYILYNMNLSMGDTLRFCMFSKGGGLGQTDSVYYNSVVVDSISIYNIGDWIGKGMYFKYDTTFDSEFGFEVLIERIGTNNGLFPYPLTNPLDSDENILLCYSDDSILYTISSDSCGYINSVSDKNLNAGIFIYPNPVSEHLKVSSPLGVDAVRIYSSDGKFQTEHKIDSKNYVLDMKDLENGIYFLEFKVADRVFHHKIIKQ